MTTRSYTETEDGPGTAEPDVETESGRLPETADPRAETGGDRLPETADLHAETEEERLPDTLERESMISQSSEALEEVHRISRRSVLREPQLYVAIAALFLFIAIIVLQLLGLKKANDLNRTGQLPKVRWCSPIFQPFGVAVRDGECHVHPIEISSNKGLGYISLPGVQQKGWLTSTIAGTSISLVIELVDFLILMYVSSDTRARGLIRLRRPWCSMFCGFAVLGVTFIFSLIYAQQLPPGMTSNIWLVVNTDRPAIYSASLLTPGLRGGLIGWNDGVFGGWGQAYFGSDVL